MRGGPRERERSGTDGPAAKGPARPAVVPSAVVPGVVGGEGVPGGPAPLVPPVRAALRRLRVGPEPQGKAGGAPRRGALGGQGPRGARVSASLAPAPVEPVGAQRRRSLQRQRSLGEPAVQDPGTRFSCGLVRTGA